MRMKLAVLCGLLLASSPSLARETCESGGYDAVMSPDSTSLTILFDNVVASTAAPQAQCSFDIPLSLPEGMSLGVYRVDYRGFAVLERKASANLEVDYAFGSRDTGRRFKRAVKGAHDGDFLLTENIGAGLMKRFGCGENARLRGSVTLTLDSRSADAVAALDSSDGASRGELVYHFQMKRCGP